MKITTMKIAALVGAVAALSDNQLNRLKEINELRKNGAFTDEEYETHKKSIMDESPRRQLADSNQVAKSKCLAGMVTKMQGDVDKATTASNSLKNANAPAVAAIIKYLVTQPPKVTVSGGSSGQSSGQVVCKSSFTCSCSGGSG